MSGSEFQALLRGGKPKRSKYGAVRTVDADGIRWDSKAERQRYEVLKWLQTLGEISHLERQPRFNIIMKRVQCGFYKADFAYIKNGERVYEDVKCKATMTSVYRLKKKLVEAQYKVVITEVGAGR